MRKPGLRGRGWGAGFGLLLLGTLAAGSAAGQPATAMARIQRAFVQGDAQALLYGAAERVELSLPGRSKLYSRAQATYVMEEFFREFPPARFVLERESKTEDSWIAVGHYGYRRAEHPLRVYVRLRLKGQQWALREIRVEQRPRE